MSQRRRQWKPRFTPSEFQRGWVFFALYLLVFPVLTAQLQRLAARKWDVFLPAPEWDLLYYCLLAVLTLLLFWGFLKDEFDILLDWLPENLFALVTGLVACLALTLLVSLVPMPVQNPAALLYPRQLALSPKITVLLVVVLIPLVEETLFRGLLFGGVRRYSVPLAYLASALGFALFRALGFVFTAREGVSPACLALSLHYLPLGLSASWCYDRGGSVWSAVVLRAAAGAAALFWLAA